MAGAQCPCDDVLCTCSLNLLVSNQQIGKLPGKKYYKYDLL